MVGVDPLGAGFIISSCAYVMSIISGRHVLCSCEHFSFTFFFRFGPITKTRKRVDPIISIIAGCTKPDVQNRSCSIHCCDQRFDVLAYWWASPSCNSFILSWSDRRQVPTPDFSATCIYIQCDTVLKGENTFEGVMRCVNCGE